MIPNIYIYIHLKRLEAFIYTYIYSYIYKLLNHNYTYLSNTSCRNPNFQIENHALLYIYTQEKIQSGNKIHHYMFRANVELDYKQCQYPSKMRFNRYQRPN